MDTSLLPQSSAKYSRSTAQRHFDTVAAALEFLTTQHPRQPTLTELAHAVACSESQIQRIFSEWAGLSPKQFMQYLSKENAKRQLKQHAVLEAAYAAGLSSSGRLHDLLIRSEAVTPGEYKSAGVGLSIGYGVHSCVFGYCFIAATTRGICHMSFFDSEQQFPPILQTFMQQWPNASIAENTHLTQPLFTRIFNHDDEHQAALPILLKGSPFQMQVWEALMRIPAGAMHSYQQVAAAIGKPAAVRAVASAVANNNIAYLIPCHRVILSSGVINKYRWGEHRKAAMLGWEHGHSNRQQN